MHWSENELRGQDGQLCVYVGAIEDRRGDLDVHVLDGSHKPDLHQRQTDLLLY